MGTSSRPGQVCPVEGSGCLDLDSELLPCGENGGACFFFQSESSWAPRQRCQRGGDQPVPLPQALVDCPLTGGLHSCNQNVNTVEKPSVLMIKDIGELPQTGEAFPVQLWDRHLPGPAGGALPVQVKGEKQMSASVSTAPSTPFLEGHPTWKKRPSQMQQYQVSRVSPREAFLVLSDYCSSQNKGRES